MTTPVPPAPVPSPIDAAREAFDYTRRQLFPLRPEKWLLLGLFSFLDQCGRSFRGGGVGSPGGSGVEMGDSVPSLQPLLEWVRSAALWLSDHAAMVTLGVLGGVLVFAVIAGAVLWINSRGVFLYLDAVIGARPAFSRPWRQHAPAATSYFVWSFGLSMAGLGLVLFAAALVLTGAVAFATGRLHGGGGTLVMLAIAPILVLLLLALPLLALAALCLRDFVAPLQLATGQPCGAAVRLLEALVTANPGVFLLYLLLKLLVTVASGMLILVIGCFTCCIGFLPVVMQVLFQPLFFFDRAFPVFLLRQLGYDAAAGVSARLP